MRKKAFVKGYAFIAMMTIALFAFIGFFTPTYAGNLAGNPSIGLFTPTYAGNTSDLEMPAVSQGPNTMGKGQVYYSDCNSYGPTTPFYEYDVDTDTWTQLASIPGPNTTQLTSDEKGSVYSLPEDGKIYVYDPSTNGWNFVMDGPSASVGRNNVSMFEAHDGEFYWGKDGVSTLYYTVGGVWNSITTPRAPSCASSVDRDTGLIYIRTYHELGFFAFDPSVIDFVQICDVGTYVLENSRVGAFYDGEFFSRTQAGTYQGIDVLTCDQRETGVAPTSTHSATGEDRMGNIYSNGYPADTVFEVFNVPTNTLIRLADAPDIPDGAHSTLVAVDVVCVELQTFPPILFCW